MEAHEGCVMAGRFRCGLALVRRSSWSLRSSRRRPFGDALQVSFIASSLFPAGGAATMFLLDQLSSESRSLRASAWLLFIIGLISLVSVAAAYFKPPGVYGVKRVRTGPTVGSPSSVKSRSVWAESAGLGNAGLNPTWIVNYVKCVSTRR